MHTWVIDEHAVPPIDTDIVRALRPDADMLTGGGIALNLGILAPNGRVYRVARAWGLDDYNRAAQALQRLGLTPTGQPLRLPGISLEEVFVGAGG